MLVRPAVASWNQAILRRLMAVRARVPYRHCDDEGWKKKTRYKIPATERMGPSRCCATTAWVATENKTKYLVGNRSVCGKLAYANAPPPSKSIL